MSFKTGLRFLVLFLLTVFVGVTIGVAYMYFFGSFRIDKSPVIKNEVSLRRYLDISGTFPKPLKTTAKYGAQTVRRFSIVPQTKFLQTVDCISDRIGQGPVFCFFETTRDGQMTINIYPGPEISEVPAETKNRLLNLNLLAILESRFGISPAKKNLILDYGEGNYIFKW